MLIGLTVYKHYSFTNLTLKYIEKYTNLSKHRVIIVDNCKESSTKEQIKHDFPWVEQIIVNDINSQPKAFNILIKERKKDEDYVYIPNDIIVSPNWLELLWEDAYKYSNVGITSPYIPFDLNYDDKVNEYFKNHYFSNVYPLLKDDPSVEELENYLNILYDGDYEKFCLDFSARNKNENMLDESINHVMYCKSWLFEKIGLYDEVYSPWGNEDRDFMIRMNNAEIYRTCSSRCFVHHWLSITQRQLFHDAENWRAEADRKSIRLLQKWEPIKDSETYLDIPKPSKLPNWRTNYRKFKLRQPMLSYDEAKKIDGIPYMLWEGLHPGVNYFSQIKEGSILRKSGVNWHVDKRIENNKLCLRKKGKPISGEIWLDNYLYLDEKQFLDEKWHVDYFKR